MRLQKLGIDTYKEAVLYVRSDCQVCQAEGFQAHTRVKVTVGSRSLIATINVVSGELLAPYYASLSKDAWEQLSAKVDDVVFVTHAKPLLSLSAIRAKVYGNPFSEDQLRDVVDDIAQGQYSDIHISAFLTACAGDRLDINEITNLTKAMIHSGERLSWKSENVVDKHCVGGLPGNRTTPIVVSIVSAFGLTMPKTSSRAITSPAGTADTMEVFAPVTLSLAKMKKVVEAEKGCVTWGGSLSLSPVDDRLIQVERSLDLDSEGQLVASILSKKIAAGSNFVLIDIPIGPTAKVRSSEKGLILKQYLEATGEAFGIKVKTVMTDGTQPIGRGIGPALEARDIHQVLTCDQYAPQDLRERALFLASNIIEPFRGGDSRTGLQIATDILDSGEAWKKFQAICAAQGGMREIPQAKYTHPYEAKTSGTVISIDNRHIALVAKLAGAPTNKVAGVDLHTPLGAKVRKGEPIFTLHARSPGELDYALQYIHESPEIIVLKD